MVHVLKFYMRCCRFVAAERQVPDGWLRGQIEKLYKDLRRDVIGKENEWVRKRNARRYCERYQFWMECKPVIDEVFDTCRYQARKRVRLTDLCRCLNSLAMHGLTTPKKWWSA